MSNTQVTTTIQPSELDRIQRLFSDQWFYSTQCYESNCSKNRLIKVCLGNLPNRKLVDDLVKLGHEIGYAYSNIRNLS